MSETSHPGSAAVALHNQYARLCNLASGKRAQAAQLRRQAKASLLKVDALALSKQAKPLSKEAGEAAAQAKSVLSSFLKTSLEAHQVLIQRMPPQWQDWGVVKTRAYTNTLAVLATQLTRTHPKPELIAGALQHLLAPADWGEQTLQVLGIVKPTTKTLPQL